ncbi:DUF397 domain-containing protein [Streptomyces sp. NPDC058330]|uniref:DUF397 domain-containing protein n=1 Tax=Streptomyces sp. NPDC058330 TaxID=3346449 RepID=UPI0036E91AFD
MAQPSTVRVGYEDGRFVWRKSSYSDHNGDCVELAEAGHSVAFRDSKDSQGPVISVGRRAAVVFVSAMTEGRLSAGRV